MNLLTRGSRMALVMFLVLAVPKGGGPIASATRAAPPLVSSSRTSAATDFVDSVRMWIPSERIAHRVRWIRAQPDAKQATFGRLRLPVRGLAMQPGGVVYVRLRTACPDATAIAIRWATMPEHHGRTQSYTVEADGLQLASEVYVDPGAGATRTAFVEYDGRAPSVTVRVCAGWRNAFPIVLDSIRAYKITNEAAMTPAGDTRYRMGLALLSSKGSGFAIDRSEMDTIEERIPASEWFVPQAAVLYNFCRRSRSEQYAAMRQFGDLAASSRFPLRVLPQMHWAGIPTGVPDGAGGTFTDVPYQQITWDQDDRTEEPGLKPLLGDRYDVRYGLSVPNRWGNTPWLTFNHPRLNQFRRARLREAMTAWLNVRETLGRWGLAHLFPGEISTGEETVYWAKGVDDSAYTQYNGGKPRNALLADFNPFVVADAMADGIILDPTNGLDRNERWWLHQNLARWQQTIVDWLGEAIPPEPIKATPAGPVFAEDLVRHNIFTEPYAMPVFPMRGVNPLRPGLEVGYVRDGRSGGEYWSGATMLPWLIKERERGRIALPNLECTGADDAQLQACLLAAYAHGARYATLYHWHHRPHIRNILADVADRIGKASQPLALVREATSVQMNNELVERTFRAEADAFGVNVLVAILESVPPEVRLVRLTIRTLDEKPERNVSVTVAVPPSRLEPIEVSARLPLMFALQPGQRYAVVVQDPASGQLTARHVARITALADVRLERWRSLCVADLQDAEDILESLTAKDRDPWTNEHARMRLQLARTLLERGRPLDAYRAAIRAEQLMFPASFLLQAPGGKLNPFPVEITCTEERVRATIHTLSLHTASVSVLCSVAQHVRIRCRGKAAALDLAPNVPARIDIELGGRPTHERPESAEVPPPRSEVGGQHGSM